MSSRHVGLARANSCFEAVHAMRVCQEDPAGDPWVDTRRPVGNCFHQAGEGIRLEVAAHAGDRDSLEPLVGEVHNCLEELLEALNSCSLVGEDRDHSPDFLQLRGCMAD